mgnify:CR=1 FL=1
MKSFLNEELKQFKDLSDEEMLAIVKANIACECEWYGNSGWVPAIEELLNVNYIYRTKPPKQLVIPWAVLNKEFKHAAMDRTTGVAIFLEEPVRHDHVWMGFGKFNLSYAITIDTDGIDWKTSLVTRPEGV